MTENYQDIVFKFFKNKQEKQELHPCLLKPTAAKLKRECLRVYDKRYTAQDADIFAMFFDADKIGANFRKMILAADPGDFRPLLNHLIQKTTKTDERNTELLAWLIDFQPRPSTIYYKSFYGGSSIEVQPIIDCSNREEIGISKSDDPTTIIEDIKEEELSDDVPTLVDVTTILENQISSSEIGHAGVKVSTEGRKIKLTKNKAVLAVVLLMLVTLMMGGAYWLMERNQRCMYWAGDHYEMVACDSKIDETPVVALKEEKVRHFRKITNPDTISLNSVDRVWYSKINNEVEFFTAKGKHPIKTDRVLKPLSIYIWQKYGASKRLSEIDED
ncbi:hypothetical protein [Pedobacter sp. ASV28]|uniref:hypothetical protein n=1 Tax=Pedobacter sp. ASV28 TaxID=2795123 RepID=UPI0018EB9EED|nr:hypothetical protein [Pedobacter sp. ASV28]